MATNNKNDAPTAVSRRNEDQKFNDDLAESLEKTFSGEFGSVIKSEGLVGEKFKGQHTKLLDIVGDQTQKLAKAVPLTLGQRFKDFFTNWVGVATHNRARRKRIERVEQATILEQADIQDIAKSLAGSETRDKQLLEWERKKWIFSGKQSKLFRLLDFRQSLFGKMLGKKDDEGAKATEEKREALGFQKKQISLLSRIADAVGAKPGVAGAVDADDEEQKGWTLGKGLIASTIPVALMAGIPAILATSLATLGIGAVVALGIWGVAAAAKDGVKAWTEAEQGKWGTVDKTSAMIGGFLGGKKKGGIWNALAKAGDFALIGMGAGAVFGLPGILIGAIVGAAAGGILGWIGGQAIADFVNNTVLALRNILDMPELLSPEQKAAIAVEKAALVAENAALETSSTSILEKLEMYNKILADDNSTLEERIEALDQKAILERKLRTNEDIIATNIKKIATDNRRLAESALAVQDDLLKENKKYIIEARAEVDSAQARTAQASQRVFWAKLIHGKGSVEHVKAVEEFNQAEQALNDRRDHVTILEEQRVGMKADRKAERIEIDKEHQTWMGELRLFVFGEQQWQQNIVTNVSAIQKDIMNWWNGIWEWTTETGAAIVAATKGGWANVKTFIGNTWDDVIGWFKKKWEWTTKTGAAIVAATKDTFTNVKAFMGRAWVATTGWFSEKWEWAQTTGSDIVAATPGAFTTAKEKLKGIYGATTSWFGKKWEWAGDTGSKIVAATPGAFTTAKEKLKGIYGATTGWFGEKWEWTTNTGANIVKDTVGTFTTAKDKVKSIYGATTGWFSDKWTWGQTTEDEIAGTFTVGGLIGDAFKNIKKWLRGIFGLGKDEEGKPISIVVPKEVKDFSIGDMIAELWGNILQAIKDIIPTFAEIKAMLPDPGEMLAALKTKMKFGDVTTERIEEAIEKHGVSKKGAVEAGLYDVDRFGASEINKAALEAGVKSGGIQANMLQAILDAGDLRPEDIDFMMGLMSFFGSTALGGRPGARRNAAGGWMRGGRPTLVGELGPELIIPSTSGQVLNAQRTAQIQAAGLQRGAMGQGAGLSVINAPVTSINNSQSNMTHTSTSFSHPSPLLAKVNAAA